MATCPNCCERARLYIIPPAGEAMCAPCHLAAAHHGAPSDCPDCGGPAYPMGILGNEIHSRCENCLVEPYVSLRAVT